MREEGRAGPVSPHFEKTSTCDIIMYESPVLVVLNNDRLSRPDFPPCFP